MRRVNLGETFTPFTGGCCYPVPLAVSTGSREATAFRALLRLFGITPLELVVGGSTFIVHPDHLVFAEESISQAHSARDARISAVTAGAMPVNVAQITADTDSDIAAMRVAAMLIPAPAAVGGAVPAAVGAAVPAAVGGAVPAAVGAAVPAAAQVQVPLWQLVGQVDREIAHAYKALGVRTSIVKLGDVACIVPTAHAVLATRTYEPGTPAPIVSVPSGGITLRDAYAETLPTIVRALARTFGREAISFVEVTDPDTRVAWFVTVPPTADVGAVIRRLGLAHH